MPDLHALEPNTRVRVRSISEVAAALQGKLGTVSRPASGDGFFVDLDEPVANQRQYKFSERQLEKVSF